MMYKGIHNRIMERSIDGMIKQEAEKAAFKHGEYNSMHEAYAVLKEEVEEFWDGVKADQPDPYELIQVAAVARRACLELCEKMRKKDDNEQGKQQFLRGIGEAVGQPTPYSMSCNNEKLVELQESLKRVMQSARVVITGDESKPDKSFGSLSESKDSKPLDKAFEEHVERLGL